MKNVLAKCNKSKGKISPKKNSSKMP